MKTSFSFCHPVTNLIFFLSVTVFTFLFKHPLTVGVCFVAAFSYYLFLCGKKAMKSFFTFLLPVMLLAVLVNGLFSHYGVTPLLSLPDGNSLTLESLIYGLVLGAVTVSLIMWFYCYSEIVTADKFFFLFGRIFPSWALIASMALRFVPLYRRRFFEIAEAQRGIGRDYRKGKLPERISTFTGIISILFSWSLENAIEVSDSMKARGYGLTKRKSYGRFRFTARDGVLTAVMVLLDSVLIFGFAFKSLHCLYNPRITLYPVFGFGTVTLCAFCILCFLPLLIELSEGIKWIKSKSKI